MAEQLDPSIITRGMRQIAPVDPIQIMQQVGDLNAQRQHADYRQQQMDMARADEAMRQQAMDAAKQNESTLAEAIPKGRIAALKSLEGNPELYAKAQQHFSAIDDNYKRLMGSVAAGVRAFGDDPGAAMTALDDLIEQGFDARRLSQLRTKLVEKPEAIGELVDGLLKQSPDESHRTLVRKAAEPFTLSEGQRRFGPYGQLIAEVPKPVVEPKPPAIGSFEDYVTRRFGANPSGAQVEAAKRDYDRAGAAPQASKDPQMSWVLRDGTAARVAENQIRPGDAPYSAPKSTSETAQDRQRKGRLESAKGFLDRLNELREKINTKMGPAAGISGAARQGMAAIGWDPDVAEYERVRAAGGRSLAVAIMGAQNLSDADAKAWADMLPGARVDAETAKRLTNQIGKMLKDDDLVASDKTDAKPTAQELIDKYR